MISDLEYMAEVRLIPAISDAISDTLFNIDTEKGDGLETPDIMRYNYGAILVEGEYPAFSIMGMRETIFRDEEDWRISSYTYAMEVYAVGDDSEKLERYCARYARAINDILWDTYPTLGTLQSIEYPPVMTRGTALFKGISVVFRLLVKQNRSD